MSSSSRRKYRVSSYSFHGNYSFLNLEIQRLQYIRPKVIVHNCAETIQGRKLYEEMRYPKSRIQTILSILIHQTFWNRLIRQLHLNVDMDRAQPTWLIHTFSTNCNFLAKMCKHLKHFCSSVP